MTHEQTIRPPDLDTAELRAIAMLRELAPGASVQLELGAVIGEGGMGVIYMAQQLALGRTVAVKTLKPDHTDPDAVRDLLREAWITGSLEHPNVVPVHHLELDRNGIPMIVLKRIEGMAWSSLIRAEDDVRHRFGATELLGWNLGILVQMLNAVRFAHSRGILHRDLKPSNVMIGEFGEVYVLDWGIAVSLVDDRSGRLPLAKRVRHMAGTPGYMAPEMLGRDSDVLSERTDVYLAGAVLFEILTGRPPHGGRDALTVLTQILTVQPVLPATAPIELARICHRALDADPDRRFASIDDLRLAVQSYLDHRGSLELAERAHADLAGLRDPDVLVGSRREEIYRLFGACRFGFHQALAVWPENITAREGLIAATVALAEYELDHDNATGAFALLGEGDVPAELVERVRTAAEAHAKRQRELERFHQSLDPAIHQNTRTYVGVVLGLLFTLLPLFNGGLSNAATFAARLPYIAFSFAVAAGLLGFGWISRATFGSTAVNRRALVSAALGFAGQGSLAIGGWALALPATVIQVMALAQWAIVIALLAVHFERRLTISAVCYLVGFFVAARWPDVRPYAASAANLVLTISVFHVWLTARRAVTPLR